MSAPLISLLHPTRRVSPSEGFPRGWRDAHDAWLERADHPENIEYVLSVHESRWTEAGNDTRLKYGTIATDPWAAFQCVKNSDRDNCVDNLNNAAKHSTGQLLVGVADDLYPPEHWDTLVLDALECPETIRQGKVLLEIVCIFSSGASPERDRELMTCGALTRKRYERYGFILDPEFESMFADNWLGYQTRKDQAEGKCQIVERLDIQFEHRHPIFGKAKMDEAYEQQNRESAYRQGYATFARKQHGTKVLAACFAGETFRAEIAWANSDLLTYLSMGTRFIVARYGGHTSNVYVTRMELAEAVLSGCPSSDLVYWQDDDNIVTIGQFDMLYQDLVDHPDIDIVVGCCWCDNDGKPNPDGSRKPWTLSFGRQDAELGRKAFTMEEFQTAYVRGDMLITSDDLAPDRFWSGFPAVLMRGSALRTVGAEAFRARTADPEMLACLKAARFHVKAFNSDHDRELLARMDAAIKQAELIAACKWGQTSEDTSFFLAAYEKGLKCAVDLRVKVPHGKFRAIEPQFIPQSQKTEAEKAAGKVPVEVFAGAD